MGTNNSEVGFCLITSEQMAKCQISDIKVLMARIISRLVPLVGADVLFILDDIAFHVCWILSAPSEIVSALTINSNHHRVK